MYVDILSAVFSRLLVHNKRQNTINSSLKVAKLFCRLCILITYLIPRKLMSLLFCF